MYKNATSVVKEYYKKIPLEISFLTGFKLITNVFDIYYYEDRIGFPARGL